MSWEVIFENITLFIRLMIMIGPLIEIVESIIGEIFPGEKVGKDKKEVVIKLAIRKLGDEIPVEVISFVIDEYVDQKNKSGQFKHSV